MSGVGGFVSYSMAFGQSLGNPSVKFSFKHSMYIHAHIIISIIYNFSKVDNLGKYDFFGFSRHSHCCFSFLPTPSHSFCVDFPISFQLTSLIFSHFYLQITLTCFYSFYCLFPAMVPFYVPGSYGYSGLNIHTWRFEIRSHR